MYDLFTQTSREAIVHIPATCAKPALKINKVALPQLKWEDFRAEPKEDSKFHAHCYWRISYTYSVLFLKDKIDVSVDSKCIFEEDRAWVKHEFKNLKLLEHEQGHYYIGCLCALEFKRRVEDEHLLQSNYKSEIKRIFSETLKEYLDLELQYDVETQHFKNQEKQKVWDEDLCLKLKGLQTYWWF